VSAARLWLVSGPVNTSPEVGLRLSWVWACA